ncbi:hypothetical protein D3C85_1774910 [compost metagenome]
MINRICDICKGYVNDVWVINISDNQEKIEISGCKNHIDELHKKIKSIKNLEKLPVQKVLKLINYKEMD